MLSLLRPPAIAPRQKQWEPSFEPESQRKKRIGSTTPCRAEEMSALAVSPLVNSARVDDPRCCQPGASVPQVFEKLKIKRRESGLDQQTLGLIMAANMGSS